VDALRRKPDMRYAVKALTGDDQVIGDTQVEVVSIRDLVVFQLPPEATEGDFALVRQHLRQVFEGSRKNFLLLGANVRVVELEEVS
jgi:hypothetical protein